MSADVVEGPEWAAERRRVVEAQQLLEEVERRQAEIDAANLRRIAKAKWPNREQIDLEFTINEAIVIANNRGDGPSSRTRVSEAQRAAKPSRNGAPKDARVLCLERLREDPNRDWREVHAEAIKLGLWKDTERRFIVVPWRIAKLQERKERTGSIKAKKPGKTVAQTVPVPTLPQQDHEPETRSKVVHGLDSTGTRIDFRTACGQVSVRPEEDDWKLILVASLDKKTIDHLVPLLTAILLAGALD